MSVINNTYFSECIGKKIYYTYSEHDYRFTILSYCM